MKISKDDRKHLQELHTYMGEQLNAVSSDETNILNRPAHDQVEEELQAISMEIGNLVIWRSLIRRLFNDESGCGKCGERDRYTRELTRELTAAKNNIAMQQRIIEIQTNLLEKIGKKSNADNE